MSLTLPSAGITPGRSADLRVATPTIGDDIAKLGQVMQQVGRAVEDERNDRLFQRAQIDMLARFNQLRLDLDQIGDPDAREAEFTRGSAEIGQQLQATLPEALHERFGQQHREMTVRTAYPVGRDVLALRQSDQVAIFSQVRDVTLQGAVYGDADAAAVNEEQFWAFAARMQERGMMTPAQVQAAHDSWRTDLAQGRAARFLNGDPERNIVSDPQALLTALDGPEFQALSPEQRERFRAQAITRIDQANREELTALNRMAGEAVRVIHAGSEYTATDALLADPRIDQTDNGAALRAAAEFQRAEPSFFVMTPRQMREALAERQRQPIAPGNAHEIAQRQVMAAAVEAAEAEWTRDPIGRGMRVLGLRDTSLPNPLTTAPDVLEAALAARAAQAQTLADAGYTETPVLFRPEERASWTEATAVTTDPTQRASLAAIVARALGDDTEAVARQVSDDPVFGYVGGMLAAVGESAQPLARSIFEGRRAIANGDVPLPSEAARRQFWFQNFEGLFDNFTETGLRDQVIAAADALAALRLRGHPDAAQADARQQIWLQSAHEVMGGTGSYGSREARGGVQNLRGVLTIMPEGVSARDVGARLDELARGLSLSSVERLLGDDARNTDPDTRIRRIWREFSVTGAAPAIGGEVINRNTLRALTFQAYRDGSYLAFYNAPNGQPLLVTGEDGAPFRLDMRALVEWQP